MTLILDVTARAASPDPAKTSAVTITEIKVPALLYERCTPPQTPGAGGGSCLSRREPSTRQASR